MLGYFASYIKNHTNNINLNMIRRGMAKVTFKTRQMVEDPEFQNLCMDQLRLAQERYFKTDWVMLEKNFNLITAPLIKQIKEFFSGPAKENLHYIRKRIIGDEELFYVRKFVDDYKTLRHSFIARDKTNHPLIDLFIVQHFVEVQKPLAISGFDYFMLMFM
jgi:hypothetical protein